MGLLEGKKALIFGVANDHSIAWGIARALRRPGRDGRLQLHRVAHRAAGAAARRLHRLDVRGGLRRPGRRPDRACLRALAGGGHGELDILVHALAFARREDLDGAFVDTSRDGFALALDVSAYSLVAVTRAALPLMAAGGSILTLSYYGAEKVVANYNVMGVAKAALEACVRYLAVDLGPRGIRVNAISAGPIRTLSAVGIAGFRVMYGEFRDVAPLRRNVDIDDVGGCCRLPRRATWRPRSRARSITSTRASTCWGSRPAATEATRQAPDGRRQNGPEGNETPEGTAAP